MEIHRITFYLSIVSFLMNFSTAIMISSSFGLFVNSANTYLIFARSIGDGFGSLSKIFVGFLSDILGSRKNFLLVGYGSLLLIKPLFLLSTCQSISIEIRLILFTVANVLDKSFNVMRDIIRDAIMRDYLSVEEIRQNSIFRKISSYLGTCLGAIFAYIYLQKISVNLFTLFFIALSISFVGLFILFLSITDSTNLTKRSFSEGTKAMLQKGDLMAFLNRNYIFFIIGIGLIYIGRINEFTLYNHLGKILNFTNKHLLFILYYSSSFISSVFIYFIRLGFLSGISLILALYFGANILIFKFSMDLFVLFGAIVTYGICNGIFDSLSIITILERFTEKKNYIGSVLSVFNISTSLGNFINAAWFKICYQYFSWNYLFIISLFPLVFAFFFILAFFPEKPIKPKKIL